MDEFNPSKDCVLVNGTHAINGELAYRGIRSLNVHDMLQQAVESLDSDVVEADRYAAAITAVVQHQLDSSVRAVVAGIDPQMSYGSMSLAHRYVVDQAGTPREKIFIATNLDATYPVGSGVFLPGSGSGIALLQTSTGRVPLAMGKPERHMMDAIITDKRFDRSRTLMVGDRCDTDVAFASRADVHSALVFSGVTVPRALHGRFAASIVPGEPLFVSDGAYNLATFSLTHALSHGSAIGQTHPSATESNSNIHSPVDGSAQEEDSCADSSPPETTLGRRINALVSVGMMGADLHLHGMVGPAVEDFSSMPTFVLPSAAWLTGEGPILEDISEFEAEAISHTLAEMEFLTLSANTSK